MLDTGSAAFTVLSTPALSPGVTRAQPLRTLSVPSFGRPPATPQVYGFEDADVEAQLRGAGIDGLVGLAAFRGAIAFDFARERVALRR